jgi:hypothetical protein
MGLSAVTPDVAKLLAVVSLRSGLWLASAFYDMSKTCQVKDILGFTRPL